MAGFRSMSERINGYWLAALLGAVVLNGTHAGGQVPSDPLLAAPVPDSPAAGAQDMVVQIRIEGNSRVPLKQILSEIRTRAGRPYDGELIQADVRRLYGTDRFVRVSPFSQRVEGGRVVIFKVFERPVVEYVKYVGNEEIKKQKLEKEADVNVGDSLDPFAVEEGRRRIEEYYHSQGFAKARVTVVEGNKPDDRGAIYLINEGTKQKVFWTNFVGNDFVSDARLATKIQSKHGALWLFGGEADRQKINGDVDRLTAYYRSLGFFRARVGHYSNYDDDQEWLSLTFVIDEGPRYQIRNVSFIGNTKFAGEELSVPLNLKAGIYYNQDELQQDVLSIQDKYGAIGYVFADVQVDTRLLEQPGPIDLVYNIKEGYRCRVGKITPLIDGEFPHTRISTVLNRISLKPGDVLDVRQLRASERRLKASGLFEVDPTQGLAPKIVFSPPDLEDMEVQQARRPGGEYRGQSPDSRSHTAYRPAETNTGEPAERWLDVQVQGNWIGDGPPSPAGPTEAQPADGGYYDQSTPRPQYPIIRGQYSADAGRTIPSVRPASNNGWGSPYAQPPISTGVSTPSYPGSSAPLVAVAPSSGYLVPPAPQMPPPGSSQPSVQFSSQSQLPPPGQIEYVQPGIINDGSPLLGLPPDQEPVNFIDLGPQVQETRTGRFMLSAGINSDAGLLGSIIVDEQNFDIMRFPSSWQDVRDGVAWRGAGQRFRMEAVPGTEVQKYTINFQEPYLLNTRVSLGLSGYYYNRRYFEWDEDRIGGRVALGYQLTPDLSGVFAYRGAKINIYDAIPGVPELDEVLGANALHGFRFSLTHDTRDNPFLATQGHLIELSYEQVTGSFNYPRGEIDIRRYFMLHERPDHSGRHVVSVAGRFAVTGADTPVYEHYYIGGYSTLRGFDFRGASPRDPGTGTLVGGEMMLLASAEYMFPITADDMIRGVVFCDTGTVEPTIDNWRDEYRVSPGVGLRITVPAMGPAPIALDFGFPALFNDGDEIENFSFFIGFLR